MDIREGLSDKIIENVTYNRCRGVVFTVTGLNNIMDFLRTEGMVRKVEGELPDMPSDPSMGDFLIRKTQQDMLKAGFVKVRELDD